MKNLIHLDKTYILAARQAAEKYNYGETISHEWLYEAFRLSLPAKGTKADFDKFALKLMACMDGFKSIMLEDYKMHIVASKGIGYLIVKPGEQTEVAMGTAKSKIAAEIKKAIVILRNVNESLLTDKEMHERDDNLCKLAAVQAFKKKTLTHFKK